jgi:uncharacterized protein
MATLVAVLTLSLFGSLHCAGMCGALVAFAVGGSESCSHLTRVALQAAYHGGRWCSYALLGAACGLVGAALDLGGSLVGLQRVACVLAGAMMVVVGVVAVLRYGGVRLPALSVPAWFSRLLRVGQRAAVGLRPLPRAATIGLITALLPCGWLYAFAIVAAGTGSAGWGAAVMTAFWLGTVPILVSVGTAVQAWTGTLGRRLPLVTAVLIVLVGLGTIAQRWALSGETWQWPAALTADSNLPRQLEALEDTTPPCCRHAGHTSPP